MALLKNAHSSVHFLFSRFSVGSCFTKGRSGELFVGAGFGGLVRVFHRILSENT
jgi:hypothetical protein